MAGHPIIRPNKQKLQATSEASLVIRWIVKKYASEKAQQRGDGGRGLDGL